MVKKGLKKIVKVGLLLWGLDKLFLPSISLFVNNQLDNVNIQEAMRTENYSCEYFGENEEVALNYLKLAHAITMKYMDLGNVPFGVLPSESLYRRVGDCFETSTFSYSNYIYLINRDNKQYLSDYVRMASGTIDGSLGTGGHAWLELRQGNKWVPYESTINNLSRFQKIYPHLIDDLVPSSIVLDPINNNYCRTNICQVDERGVEINSLDLLGILKGKGLALTLIDKLN